MGTRGTRPAKRRAVKQRAAPRNAELEQQIVAAPNDPAPYLVHADWLQQAGEPRGELAAIQAAQLEARGAELARLLIAEQELLERHAKHFYGPLQRFGAARRTHLAWFGGFVRGMDGSFKPEAAAAFLDHPSARLIQQLVLMDVEFPPPLLTHLSTASQADLSWVWHQPRLRTLRAASWGEQTLGQPAHPELRLLHVHAPGDGLLRGLTREALPGLQRLGLTGLRAGQAGLLGELPDVELTLGLRPGRDEATYHGLGDVSGRVSTLVLQDLGDGPLASLRGLDFGRVERLEVHGVSYDVRNTMYDSLPELPALREVDLRQPADLVGYYRGFAQGALAGQVQRLSVFISRPAAGRALTEGRYERLTELRLSFDPTSGPDYLQSGRVLGSEAFANVRSLRLGPARHVEALAATPLGARIERLRVPVDRDRDARQLLDHLGKLSGLRLLELEGERVLSPEVLTGLLTGAPEVRWLPKSWEADD